MYYISIVSRRFYPVCCFVRKLDLFQIAVYFENTFQLRRNIETNKRLSLFGTAFTFPLVIFEFIRCFHCFHL